MPVDVTDQAAVAALADSVVSEFGGLDVVVECAGLMPLSPLSALKLEDWDRMIDVNIRGLLHSIAAVLPHFQRQGGGHFVTIASTAAREVLPASRGVQRHQVRGAGDHRGTAARKRSGHHG